MNLKKPIKKDDKCLKDVWGGKKDKKKFIVKKCVTMSIGLRFGQNWEQVLGLKPCIFRLAFPSHFLIFIF